MVVIAVLAVLTLAFANGANDNGKGVATLVAAGIGSRRRIILFAAGATLLGSIAAVALAGELLDRFSGKGIVDDALIGAAAFPTCVAFAAAVTVLLATRIGMPVSTTHALVGGIAGVGLSAGALHADRLVGVFVVPLLCAPLLALLLSGSLYPLLRWVRLRLGVTRHTCVCVERQFHPVRVEPDGSMVMLATGLRLSPEHDARLCRQRYAGRVVGVDAQRVLDGAHVFSAGAISFARGLNDTPKMAALLLVAGVFPSGWGMVAVGLGIALGGVLAVKRVTKTMSDDITAMNDGQAFTANLITAVCVIFASRLGVPVSTTHVSCGSLFGIGLINRQARLRVIAQILIAWITTLPLAAAIGWIAWRLLA